MTDKQGNQAFLDFALRLVEDAGELALKYFRLPISVDDKPGKKGFDPVTAADREIEAFIRDAIIKKFPDHAVVGEEHRDREGAGRFKWVIDPIDGTKSFITGTPMWGVLLGLMEGANCRLGLMRQPYLGETYVGSGAGAFFLKGSTKQPLSARDTGELARAILYCTHPSIFISAADLESFQSVAERCRLMRYGGDCYAYCLLAHGFIDLVIEGGLQAYDIIPLIPIIEAAGGVVTDWRGEPPLNGGNVIAACNSRLHEQALTVLNARHS